MTPIPTETAPSTINTDISCMICAALTLAIGALGYVEFWIWMAGE